MTTSFCPNSFQLKLAFNPNKKHPLSSNFNFSPPSFSYYRFNPQKLNRYIKVHSSSSGDSFSGWFGNDEKEPTNKEKKKWPGGIVGAGVGGFILVAGLTFASLSISKRSTSKPIQEMEPLTRQEETMLAADDQNDRVEQDEKDGRDTPSGSTAPGIESDSSSPTELNEGTNGNTQSSSDLDSTVTNGNANSNASSEEVLENGSANDGMLVVTHVNDGKQSEEENGSSMAPNIENSDDNLVNETLVPAIKLEEYPTDAKPNPIPHQEGNSDLTSTENFDLSSQLPFSSSVDIPSEPFDDPVESPLSADLETQTAPEENVGLSPTREDIVQNQEHVLAGENLVPLEDHSLSGDELTGKTSVSEVDLSSLNEQDTNTYSNFNESNESTNRGTSFSSAGVPAPSVVSAALQVLPGKFLVPAAVDQVHGQALLALQVLKVIEGEVRPGDLCTRREYARWLLTASNTLSRNTSSKVYPAMFIENVTELAFDDVTPEDPDFPSIQGLAEAGLISSKLSRRDLSSHEDTSSFSFFPESPLSRQDVVTWKMALEKRHLPESDRKVLHQLSGFLDIDKINPDAWPALVADLSAGENGIIALAFGFTRLFQPDKPVTKAQAAIALATGEASDIVSEELARIEAESIAENAVVAHNALVAQVEKDVNASFEKELLLEREKVNAVERMAEEARKELERLRDEREKDGIALMKERAAVESEMEVLSRLRHEVEEQMESLMSNKVAVTYEKERLSKLLKEAEYENKEITRLQHELEVERKALSMARQWAEDEAKRAREQAKVLEGARDRWEKHGIKVVVDKDLREDENVGVTWLDASKQFSVDETVNRTENLKDKLKAMAADVSGKAKITISRIIEKIQCWILVLKEWASGVTQQGLELKDASLSKMSSSLQELRQNSAGYTSSVKEGAKRVAEDCKEGVERLSQKFKT